MDVPPAIELVWDRGQGADSCIDGAELAGKVEATLGRPVRVPTRGDAGRDAGRDERATSTAVPSSEAAPGGEVLTGQVEPRASGGWVAVVAVRGGEGALRREVTLDASDCRQLDEAIVLVVALMADASVPRAPPLVVPVRQASASIGIGPDVAVAIGMLPGVATGIGFAADVTIPRYWHVAVWAHAWPLSEALDDGSGARLAAWTFGAGPCIGTPPRERWWSVFGCVGVTAGVVYANGVGLEVSRSRALSYAQGELRVGARARLSGPLFLRLELGAALPFVRAGYEFTAADGLSHEVFETAPAVPLARVGVEFLAP